MRTNRTGYLMAMLAGLAIVGASTGGVVAATSHHNTVLADAQVSAAAPLKSAVQAPSTPVSTDVPAASPSSVSSRATPASPATSATPTTPAQPSPAASSATTAPTSPTAPTAPTAPKPVASRKAPAPAAAALKFRNGKYTATGSYNSPGGIEKLGVTITLASDKVVSSALELLGGSGLSHSFQSAFQSGYSAQVIGRDIASISLGAVSGSSLTGQGFNDALKQIESQAKA